MKNLIILVLIATTLTSCFLKPHKMDIEQGNIITEANVSKLHLGMTESQVIAVMGNPLVKNIFTPNRMEYVYTFQRGYEPMQEIRVTCIFVNGKLATII